MTKAELERLQWELYPDIMRSYTGLQHPPKRIEPQEPQQAEPKRRPKRNLKPHQQILLAICRLIVK